MYNDMIIINTIPILINTTVHDGIPFSLKCKTIDIIDKNNQ